MLLPVLFLVLSVLMLIALQIKRIQQIRIAHIGLFIGIGVFFAASLGFGIRFAINEFIEVEKAKVIWATLFLYFAMASVFGFILFREKKVLPIVFLCTFLAFGVSFLAFAFAYGRSTLDNETVISSTSSALAMVGLI